MSNIDHLVTPTDENNTDLNSFGRVRYVRVTHVEKTRAPVKNISV